MDLTKIRSVMEKFFGDDPAEMPARILKTIQAEQRGDLAEIYEVLKDDLGTDVLQKYFQYYLADRKDSGQDFTPPSIGRLVAKLTGSNTKSVYDLCAGSGSLTIQHWHANEEQAKSTRYYCEERDDNAVPFLLLNLMLRNLNAEVIHRDALTLELKNRWKLTPCEQSADKEIQKSGFSFFEGGEDEEFRAETVISNPPYNITWDAPEPLLADERFSCCDIPTKSNANFAFVLTGLYRLKENGRAAFILPNGALTSEPEKASRRYLTEKHLSAVIALPERMFEATSIPTSLVLFEDQPKEEVLMLDARQIFTEEVREQRGQFGGASYTERVYKKSVNTFSDEDIEKILEQFDDGSREEGVGVLVTRERIAEQDYSWAPSRFLPFVSKEVEHRKFEDIIDDLNRVAIEQNVVKVTMNETWAREMGLLELYEMHQKSREITQEMDKTFALFGKEAVLPDYFRLSKSKVFRMDNVDKETFSSLFNFALPMWAQHIHYLNDEQNRLLAELRDALLPKLMSGEIKPVQTEEQGWQQSEQKVSTN